MPLGMRAPLANARQAQYTLLRQRAYLQQIVHQTTHSLARFFLEVDANYKQFKTASRLRAAAAQRLEAQRAFYEEGRITIDRYLDAVSQYANAVAQEAQFKTTYNISIVALEEAKGTLLAYDNIAVAEGPAARARPTSRPATSRPRTASCRSRPTAPYHPQPINGPADARPGRPDAAARTPQPEAPARCCRPRSARSARRRPRWPPQVPAGEPNIFSRREPKPVEPGVVPARATRRPRRGRSPSDLPPPLPKD